MVFNRPAWTPGSARYRWVLRPLMLFGLPALLALLGGVLLTTRVALAGQDAAEVTCTLVVPADPLSAQGLATPYRLKAPCHEGDAGSAAFVQATIVDPASGAVSVYNPLVIDDGARPAVAPAPPKLPAGAVVGVWFGFNGDNLRLADDHGSLAAGKCVNGAPKSIFGQFAYCNAPAVFSAANTAIGAGKLSVPGLGTAADGRPCPTTRDFGLVDMDQSDNVTTTYLVLADGRTAQNTAANRSALAGKRARIEVNGSDNGLLDAHVFPALGCTPYRAPDLADAGAPATALALNELQAAAHQQAPVALVPTSDPMTKVGDRGNVAKTDLYRAGVGQPPIDQASETPAAYCANLLRVGADRIQLDRSLTVRAASPDPAAANSLFTFLAQRFAGAYDDLGCPKLLKTRNPVTVNIDAKGVVVSARFAETNPPTPTPTRTSTPTSTPTSAPTHAPSPSPTHSAAHAQQPAPSPTTAVATTTHPVQTATQAAQPVRTTTQAAQPVRTTAQADHPMQTGQAPAPATTAPAKTDPAKTDPATTEPAEVPPPAAPTTNAPGLEVDAMRLKAPASRTQAVTSHTITNTAGTVLLVGGVVGGIAGYVRASRRNRGRYLADD